MPGQPPGLSGILLVSLHKGIIAVGALDAAGDKGALQQFQLSHRLIEEVTGRHPQPPAVAADVELVDIKLQDILFLVVILQAQGIEQLLELGGQGAILTFKEVFRGLLSDGAAPLHHPAGFDIGHDGPQHPTEIDPRMPEKRGVLGRHDGLDEMGGNARVGNVLAMGLLEKDPDPIDPVAIIYRALNGQNLFDILPPDLLAGIEHHQPEIGGPQAR